MTLLEEPQIVLLANPNGPHIRHVKTPEGSKFYGLPIGAPITASLEKVIKAARAAQGISAPSDADALSSTPLSSAQIEEYSAKGFATSNLGTNKHLDPATLDITALDNMHPGTGLHIVYNDGTHRVLTKNSDGSWAAEGFEASVSSVGLAYVMGATDTVVQTGDGTPAPAPKKNLKAGDTIESPEHLASLDDGTHVQHKITKAVYQKQGDSLQSTTGGYNKKVSSLNKVFAQKNLQFHSGPEKTPAEDPNAVDTTDPSGPAHQPGTVLTHDQVGALPAGHQTKYEGSGETYTSNGDGTHTHDASGSVLDHAAFGPAAQQSKVTYVGKQKPEEQDGGDAAGAAAGDGADGPQQGDAGAGGSSAVSEGVGPAGAGSGLAGQQDSGHDAAGLELKFGGDATVKQEVPQSEAIKALAAAGKPAPQFVELDSASSAGAFHAAIQALKDHNTHASSVYVYSEDEYQGMRLFLTKDGTAGFALHGDDVVSVFSHPKDDGHGQGFGPAIIQTAVDAGGKRLDAFDTTLPGLYATAGFVAVARVKWNDDYAPDGWNAADFKAYNNGKPDVVFMALSKDGKGHYSPGDGVVIPNYDDGAGVQEQFLKDGSIKKPKEHPLADDSIPGPGESITSVDQIKALKPGAIVNMQMKGSGKKYTYVKDAENSWHIGSNSGVTDGSFQTALSSKGDWTITVASEADHKAAADAKKAAEQAALPQPWPKDPEHPSSPLGYWAAPSDADKKALYAYAEHPLPPVKGDQRIVTFPDGTHAVVNGQWSHVMAYASRTQSDLNALHKGDPLPPFTWKIGSKNKTEKGAADHLTTNEEPYASWKMIGFPREVLESRTPEEASDYQGSKQPATLPTLNDVPEAAKTGSVVTNVGTFTFYPVGTRVDVHKPGVGSQPAFTLHFQKTAPNTWVTDPSQNEDLGGDGLNWSNDMFMGYLAAGQVHEVSVPDPKDITSGATPEVPAAPVAPDLTSPTVTLFPGGKLFSKNDIAAVLQSQQEASAFQVKYGFKGAKDSPLNTPDNIHGLTQAAQAAFPGIPAKPAVVAYLKQKLGIEDAPTVEPDGGDLIHIGAATPKSTGVQGLNGGDFTKAQIEAAIKILQGHQGKVFKSELGKQGSPLSVLNPVSMIEAEKDKTQNKAKFIALLQKALDDHAAAKPQPDLPSTPQAGQKMSYGDLLKAAPGTVITRPDGDYEKQSSGNWRHLNIGYKEEMDTQNLVSNGNPTLKSLPGSAEATTPKVGDTLTVDNFKNVPVGAAVKQTFLSDSGGDYASSFFDHAGPDLWINQIDSGDTWTDDDFQKLVKDHGSVITIAKLPAATQSSPALKSPSEFPTKGAYAGYLNDQLGAGKITLKQSNTLIDLYPADENAAIAAAAAVPEGPHTPIGNYPIPGNFPVGDPAVANYSVQINGAADLDALKPGDVVYYMSTDGQAWPFVKESNGEWVNGNYPDDPSSKSSNMSIVAKNMFATPAAMKASFQSETSGPKVGDKIPDLAGLQTLPVGSTIHVGSTEGPDWTLGSGNTWHHTMPDGSDTTVQTTDFDPSGFDITIVSLPDAAPAQMFPTPKAGDKLSSADIHGAGIGSAFSYHGHVYTKTSDTELTSDAGSKNQLSTLMSIADTASAKDVTWVAGTVKPMTDPSAQDTPAQAVPSAPAAPQNVKLVGISPNALDTLIPGEKIVISLGGANDPTSPVGWMTKQPDGSYVSDGTGAAVDIDNLKVYVSSGIGASFMHVMGQNTLKTGFVAPIDVQSPTDGQHVYYKSVTGEVTPVTFHEMQNHWISDTDPDQVWTPAKFMVPVKGGAVTYDNPNAAQQQAAAISQPPTGAVTAQQIKDLHDAGETNLDAKVYLLNDDASVHPMHIEYDSTAVQGTKWVDETTGDVHPTMWMIGHAQSGKLSWADPFGPATAPKSSSAPKTLSSSDISSPHDGKVIWAEDQTGIKPFTYNSTYDSWEPGGTSGLSHGQGFMKGQADDGKVWDSDPGGSAPAAAAAPAPKKLKQSDLNNPTDGMTVYSKENPSDSDALSKYVYSANEAGWVGPDGWSHTNDYMQSQASAGWLYGDDSGSSSAAAPDDLATADDFDGTQATGTSVWVDGIEPIKYTLQATGWWESEDGNTFQGNYQMQQWADNGSIHKTDPNAALSGPMNSDVLHDIVYNKKFGSTVSVKNDDGTETTFQWNENPGGGHWDNLTGDGMVKTSLGMAFAVNKGKVTLKNLSGDGHETAPGDLPAKKDFAAGDDVHAQDLQFLKAGDIVKGFGNSDVLLAKQNNGLFVNPATGTVYAPPFVMDMLGDHGIFNGHDDGKIFDQPYTGPDYIHTPKSHLNATETSAEAKAFTGDNAIAAEVGTMLVGNDGSYWLKSSDSAWMQFKDGKHVNTASNSAGGYFYKQVDAKEISPFVAAGPKTKYGYIPGKYSSGAAAYMVVGADGSGVYVNAKGDVKKLTVEAVKKNYDAGMKNYAGVPDVMPAVTEKAPKAKVKKIEDVADGTYYDGPADGPKTSVYVVSGDTVTIHKPLPAKIGASNWSVGVGVGGNPVTSWMDAAGTGATIKHNYAGVGLHLYQGYGANPPYIDTPVPEDKYTLTKQSDGKWKDGTGAVVDPQTLFLDKSLPNSYSAYYNWTIKSNGTGDPVVVEKKKANTLFAQGKLLDQYGNSAHADGYDGAITVLGWQAPVASFIKAKQVLLDAKPSDTDTLAKVKATGANFTNGPAKKYLSSVGINWDDEKASGGVERWKAIGNLIGEMTEGVEVKQDETNDATKVFKYNGQGQPMYPANLVTQNPSTIGEMNAFIKAASEDLGGTIGQMPTTMDKDQKNDWINFFKQGAFTDLYALEAKAAGQHQKSLPEGWKHPGYSENASTQYITWAPAVEGEKPATETIPGEWTTGYGLKAPQEEVTNYLIAAQMQNPTYLTLPERRMWVTAHQNKNQQQVDLLSVTAQNRKKSGVPEQSPALAWTFDIKPAKTYDSMFEGADKNPTSGWQSQAAFDYYNDNAPSNPALVAAMNSLSGNGQYYSSWSHDKEVAAVTAYFQKIKDDAAAQALIPVYTKDAVQSVEQSTHPIFNYHDQFGTKYFFKPAPAGDNYRSEAEHLGNQFGKLFGFSTTDSKLVTLDGKYGNLQKDVGGVSSLNNFNYSTLSSQQIADIGMEHLLDHFEDNDDTKGDNAKILENGRIVGIDKGRAFKHYGSWKGLTADERMDSNAPTIYAKLYNAIRAGQLKKEDLDKAYLEVHKRAVKMSRVPDARITEMLSEGMANRKQWDITYKIDGKPVPNSLKGLTAAVIDRKNRLPEDFDAMWAKVYKDAGLGALPEPPKIRLAEDTPAGLDDEMLHEQVLQVNSMGKSTSMGSGDFKDGNLTLWTDLNPDGTKNVNGQGYLRPKMQKAVINWLQPRAKSVSSAASDPSGMELHDIFGVNFVQAAKTINHHAVDGNYNQDKLDQFAGSVNLLEKDLQAWSPGLVSNTPDGASYVFPSGQKIPMNQVDQYKLMLDFYKQQVSGINTAYSAKGKIPPESFVTTFQPVKLGNPPAVFVNGAGHKVTKLANGDFIYNDGTGVSMVSASDLSSGAPDGPAHIVLQASSEQDGWQALKTVEPKEAASEYKVTYGLRHDPLGTFDKDGNLVYAGGKLRDEGGSTALSVKGNEYQVELPTGEKIWVVDGASSMKSQEGRVQFSLPKVKDASDSQASVARVMAAMQAMGIDTTEADDTTAERTYWRSMYQTLAYRMLTDADHKAVWKDVQSKMSELHVSDPDQFLQALSDSMPADEENKFWEGVWAKRFSQARMDKFISDRGYLPEYSHLDMQHSDIGTGKPRFHRFDIDRNSMEKQNKFLVSTVTGDTQDDKQNVLLDMVKAGGALSTEERLRYYGQFIGGWSSTDDQGYGSAHNIYTRIKSKNAVQNMGAHVIYSPKSMEFTDSYSYNTDHFGQPVYLTSEAPADPQYAIDNYTNGDNETLLPHADGFFDGLEAIVFDDAVKRQQAIDLLHKRGVFMIRGMPVEERIIMRANLESSLGKIQKSWKDDDK